MKNLRWFTLILCIAGIFITSVSRAKTIPFERDEISWYFHTKFFDEAFLKKDIFSPLWNGYESFDHPQISKYIYGAYLYLQDHNYSQVRDALEQKYGRWAFYTNITSDEAIADTEFVPILHNLRTLNVLTTTIILGLILVLFLQLTKSVIFSLLVTALSATHPLFVYSTAIVTSDNHLLLFGLLTIYTYLQSIKSKHPTWIILSAIFVALSIGSKLTGIFIFASVLLNELVQLVLKTTRVTTSIKRITLFVLVSALYWTAINPALFVRPFQGTWRYLSFRSFQSANIAYHVPEAGLTNLTDRSSALACTLFFHSCNVRFSNGSLTQFGIINIGLFILGLYYGFRQLFNKVSYIRFWIILGYIFAFAYLTILANYTNRYYILPMIIVFFVQLFGVWNLFYSLRGHRK